MTERTEQPLPDTSPLTAALDAPLGGTAQPYWLNDIPEFHWEICRGNEVVESIRKCADDGNRDEAEARVAELNAALAAPAGAKEGPA